MVWRGWICIDAEGGKPIPSERQALEALGVTVGEWDHGEGCYQNCALDDAAMTALDEHWGRFVWGLQPDVPGPVS